jgi:hypothetical protein
MAKQRGRSKSPKVEARPSEGDDDTPKPKPSAKSKGRSKSPAAKARHHSSKPKRSKLENLPKDGDKAWGGMFGGIKKSEVEDMAAPSRVEFNEYQKKEHGVSKSAELKKLYIADSEDHQSDYDLVVGCAIGLKARPDYDIWTEKYEEAFPEADVEDIDCAWGRHLAVILSALNSRAPSTGFTPSKANGKAKKVSQANKGKASNEPMISTNMIVLLVAVLVALGGCSWCTRQKQEHNAVCASVEKIPGVHAFQDFLKTIIPVEAYCPCKSYVQNWTTLCCWQAWCKTAGRELIFKVVFFLGLFIECGTWLAFAVMGMFMQQGQILAFLVSLLSTQLVCMILLFFVPYLPTDIFFTILLGGVLGFKWHANMMKRHGRDSVNTMLSRVPGAQLVFGRVHHSY